MSKTRSKPTHRAYAVRKTGEKSHWTEIGALWTHQDDKGFSLKLNLLPMDGSDISIRLIEPKDEADIAWDEQPEDAAQAQGGAQ